MRRWLASIACALMLSFPAIAVAAPSYMSYFGLSWLIDETQDHVNLYWAVSWDWDRSEIVTELLDAKARGMRAIVHAEFAFFIGSGQFANSCPYTYRQDAAARWDSFAQELSQRGLLDTVAAFYPLDEPDVCGLSPANTMAAIDIIRAHPLTSGKPIAVIFGCDVAKKYGGPYQNSGGHIYGNVLRTYDWAGFDCYGSTNIFTDPAWTTSRFDFSCFCVRTTPGPSYYDNFKLQLNAGQRIILVPQGFIAKDGLPDDPQLFASQANADAAVILMAPFTWFDQLYYPGIRSQPSIMQQWRTIGRSIALSNPPTANPPLPPAVSPRLQVTATDVRHFAALDLSCNDTNDVVCAIELFWQTVSNSDVQLFVRYGAGSRSLVSCAHATDYIDIPWISEGSTETFELYQMAACSATIPTGTMPVARVDVTLATNSAPPMLVATASRKTHAAAGSFDLVLAATSFDPTTEPRASGAGGSHAIVFTFDKPVTNGTATVSAGIATAGTPVFSGNEMIVPLTAVANGQFVTVSVMDVASADGGTGGSGSVRLGFLAGDVNGSRVVTLSDMLAVNADLTQPVSASNFVRDVNLSGTLTLSDLLFVNTYVTQALPAP